MALKYNVTVINGPTSAPSTATVIVLGDGASSTLNVPISLIPLSLARTPASVDVVGNAGVITAAGVLGTDGQIVTVTLSGGTLGAGTTITCTFTFRYGGV